MDEHNPLPTQDEIYKLVKDNNRMLKAMRRDAFVGGIFKFIWWGLILVVLPYFTWLYIQPYLQGALNTYQGVQQKADSVNASVSGFQDLLKKFGIGGQ